MVFCPNFSRWKKVNIGRNKTGLSGRIIFCIPGNLLRKSAKTHFLIWHSCFEPPEKPKYAISRIIMPFNNAMADEITALSRLIIMKCI